MLKDIEVEKRIEKDHVGLWWENLEMPSVSF